MRGVFVGAILAAIIAVVSSCLNATSYQCTGQDHDCGSGGLCEPDGYCSFPDPSCQFGRRFGSLGGPVANQCTVTVTPVDGGVHHDGQHSDADN